MGQYKWLFGYVDLLLSLLALMLSSLFFALLMAHPPAKKSQADPIKPPGQIAVSVCWPKSANDVDTWADGPGEPKPVGYSNKSGNIWSLLRDNLGDVDGKSPANCEAMFARETPAGEYTINIFGFALKDASVPVHIEVSMGKSGNDMHTLINTDMDIRPRQERTVIRFRLDEDGNLIDGSSNQVFKPLFQRA